MTRKERPEQLDIPLVWEKDGGTEGVTEAPAARRTSARPPAGCGVLRLGMAALADLGFTLVGIAAAGAAALVAGADLGPAQMVAGAVAGVELVSIVAVAVLWGWRATPGMLVLNARFDIALPLGRAAVCWLAWLALLPVAALPLLLGHRGRRPLERLAGGLVSCRPPASAA